MSLSTGQGRVLVHIVKACKFFVKTHGTSKKKRFFPLICFLLKRFANNQIITNVYTPISLAQESHILKVTSVAQLLVWQSKGGNIKAFHTYCRGFQYVRREESKVSGQAINKTYLFFIILLWSGYADDQAMTQLLQVWWRTVAWTSGGESKLSLQKRS